MKKRSKPVLRAEYERLAADYARAREYSEETEQKLEELGKDFDRLNDRRLRVRGARNRPRWCLVSLGADGPFKIECRFVRPEDEPRAGIDPLDGDGDNADSESKRSALV